MELERNMKRKSKWNKEKSEWSENSVFYTGNELIVAKKIPLFNIQIFFLSYNEIERKRFTKMCFIILYLNSVAEVF